MRTIVSAWTLWTVAHLRRDLPLAAGFLAVWSIGQVFRDRCWATGLCFYVPTPLVACGLLALALRAWLRRRLVPALVAVMFAGALACFTFRVENQWKTSPRPQPGDVCLVHWNVMYGALGWPRVQERLVAAGADFYLLSEMPGDRLEPLLAALGPEFTGLRLGSMAVLGRGSLAARALPTAAGKGQACHITWTWDNIERTILAIDLPSNIVVARAPLLEHVRSLVLDTHPDLVVGDFNAPRRSAVLARLPAGYEHAYDRAGCGWGCTWPVPAPLWAIDQCVVGPRLQAVRYELRSTSASDHRMQVLWFRDGGR